jgi:hypothetical protein
MRLQDTFRAIGANYIRQLLPVIPKEGVLIHRSNAGNVDHYDLFGDSATTIPPGIRTRPSYKVPDANHQPN